MSCKNKPILSADKITYFIIQHKTQSNLDDKIAQLFQYQSTDFLCYHDDDSQRDREMNIYLW